MHVAARLRRLLRGLLGALLAITAAACHRNRYAVLPEATPRGRIVSIALDAQGLPWVGTTEGLAHWNGSSWDRWSPDDSALPDYSITSIAVERSGAVWLGTYTRGVVHFDGQRFDAYDPSNSGLPGATVYAVALDGRGALWAGCAAYGVARFDGSMWTRFNQKSAGEPGATNVLSLAAGEGDAMWVGGAVGNLYHYDGRSFRAWLPSETALPPSPIFAIAARGRTAWATAGDAIYTVNASSPNAMPVRFERGREALPTDTPFRLAFDPRGRLWIGYQHVGVAVLDGDRASRIAPGSTPLPDPQIYALAPGVGATWVGTAHAVVRVEEEPMTDRDDPLLALRPRFPALQSSVHMISHSLGAMPAAAAEHLAEFGRLWAERSITAWEEWLPEVDRAAARVGRIVGAPYGTVTMFTNVSTVQAVIASCLDYVRRSKIVYSALNFPSVSYVWKAEERRGAEVYVVPSDDGITVDTERMIQAIDDRTLIVPISHVLFRSSAIQDVAAICARARSVGAMVLLDCYQSAGTVPLSVEELGVDFACGGSVKWLCGGPGAAWLYVRRDHLHAFSPRVTGWFAHRQPFAFEMPEQDYAESVWRYSGGTHAIAALYQAHAGAEIIGDIGVPRIRVKSLRQTERIIARVNSAGYRLRSPREPARRGGTVCFDFDGADRVAKALNKARFFCDHRPGSGIRMSPHFYTTDAECDRFMDEVDGLRSESSKN